MKRLLVIPAAGLVCLTLVLPASGAGDPSVPAPATAPSWAPARDVIFEGDHGIYRVSPNGGPARVTARTSLAVGVSPNGKTLAFDSDAGSLYRINIAGGGLKRLGRGIVPVWSPDGKRIAYLKVEDNGIWVMKANGTGKYKVFNDPYVESAPTVAWAPDSSKLAFVRCSPPHQADSCEHAYVYTIRLDGTHLHRVTTESGVPACPAWSSKGLLAFLNRGTEIVQKNGTLKSYPEAAGCPVWAPSGKRLAVGTGDGIFVMNSDGSGRRRITIVPHAATVIGVPAWSPDGRWLTIIDGGCVLRGDRPQQVWIVRANGTGLKRLFPNGFRPVKSGACRLR